MDGRLKQNKSNKLMKKKKKKKKKKKRTEGHFIEELGKQVGGEEGAEEVC